MENNIPILQNAPLFQGFSPSDITILLQELSPLYRPIQKGEILLHTGDQAHHIGIVLRGEMEALKIAPAGNELTVAHIHPGGVFADILSGSNTTSPVTLIARKEGEILLIPFATLFSFHSSNHHLFQILLQNLVGVISDKYFQLDHRIDLLLIRSLRQRISVFLLDEAQKHHSNTFTIPYTRAQLANYLGCERSALSRELSRMTADGLIQTQKSHFTIYADRLQASFHL